MNQFPLLLLDDTYTLIIIASVNENENENMIFDRGP